MLKKHTPHPRKNPMDPAEKELMEIFDTQGAGTGRISTRSQIHKNGDFHATIHLWIVNEYGQLLLQKRALHKHVYPGKWDISVAGHVPPGSSPLWTAVRETAEELGLEVRPEDLRSVGKVLSCQYHGDRDAPFWDREYHHIYLLRIPHKSLESFSFQDGEVTALRWMPLADFFDRTRRQDPKIVPHPEAFAMVEAWLQLNLPDAIGRVTPQSP
jgi:8-oxo-dGTP diphosphatase